MFKLLSWWNLIVDWDGGSDETTKENGAHIPFQSQWHIANTSFAYGFNAVVLPRSSPQSKHCQDVCVVSVTTRSTIRAASRKDIIASDPNVLNGAVQRTS
nr:hypothetical protein CFP56_11559 [Quercus suber]